MTAYTLIIFLILPGGKPTIWEMWFASSSQCKHGSAVIHRTYPASMADCIKQEF